MKDNALYLEADEDITSAIDKLKKAPAGPVQIVVPKRSALLQSIINLKLLKKAAEASGRELVLVTGDKIATDLAARVGLAVAPAIGGKAVIGQAKAAPVVSTEDEVIEASDPAPTPNELAQPGLPPTPKTKKLPLLRRREVPDETVPVAPVAPASATSLPGTSPSSHLAQDGPVVPELASRQPGPKIPSYHKLQRRLFWLGLAVFLVVGYFAAMYFLANAKVTLYANATKTSIDTNFIVDPAASTSDPATGTMAGQAVTYTKDLTGPFVPSGKKDVGTKASGSITVSNSTGIDQLLVSGTRFQAPDGKIFRSGADITVPKAYLDNGGDKVNGTASVTVTADQNGDTYNEGPAAYSIPALGNPKITAAGGQMAGGTTKTVTVVTQGDVDAAVAALLEKDKDTATRDLTSKATSGYLALSVSQTSKTSAVGAAPAVDAEATTASVSFKVTYTMLTVRKTDYEAAIKALEAKQVGPSNQIYDDGLATAQITLTNTDASGKANFHLTTEAFSGANIDTKALAQGLADKRYGDAIELAQKQPSVSHAEINLWPGWAAKLPSRSDKISVTIKVASGQK